MLVVLSSISKPAQPFYLKSKTAPRQHAYPMRAAGLCAWKGAWDMRVGRGTLRKQKAIQTSQTSFFKHLEFHGFKKIRKREVN
jgi:hypothetical protein